MLSVKTTGLEPLETVSNTLADSVLIKTGSGNGDLEISQRRIGSNRYGFDRSPRSLFPNRDIWGGRFGPGKAPKLWVETKNAGR